MMNPKARTYDEILQQSIVEDWGYTPTRCPHCGNGAVSYGNQDERGNDLHGVVVCSCDVCGREWWEDDEEI